MSTFRICPCTCWLSCGHCGHCCVPGVVPGAFVGISFLNSFLSRRHQRREGDMRPCYATRRAMPSKRGDECRFAHHSLSEQEGRKKKGESRRKRKNSNVAWLDDLLRPYGYPVSDCNRVTYTATTSPWSNSSLSCAIRFLGVYTSTSKRLTTSSSDSSVEIVCMILNPVCEGPWHPQVLCLCPS